MARRTLVYTPLDDIVPAEKNPKSHALNELGASLRRWGYTAPIEVDERTGRLVSGHGRVEEVAALRDLGESAPDGVDVDEQGRWLVPVVRGWASRDDAEAEAYVIAANRLVELGGWDNETLAAMLDSAKATPDGLDGIGWNDAQVDELLVSVRGYDRHLPGDVDPDEIPDPPSEPVSKLGDLWLLGKHRLLVGDATSETGHARLLAGAAVDLVLTDPPYGVGIDYGAHMDDSPGAVGELIGLFMPLVLVHPVVLLTPGQACMWDYPRPRWVLGWVHPASTSSGPWGFNWLNPVLAYGKDPYLVAGLGRMPSALVLATDREGVEGHPTPKPIAVWRWLVERGTTAEGQTVLDPFVGSGTTVIACELAGRICYGMELAPQFVDVACARYEVLTGEKPVLEATGEPHSFI